MYQPPKIRAAMTSPMTQPTSPRRPMISTPLLPLPLPRALRARGRRRLLPRRRWRPALRLPRRTPAPRSALQRRPRQRGCGCATSAPPAPPRRRAGRRRTSGREEPPCRGRRTSYGSYSTCTSFPSQASMMVLRAKSGDRLAATEGAGKRSTIVPRECKMKPFLAALWLAAVPTVYGQWNYGPEHPGVTATGEAEIRVVPDLVEIALGVETRDAELGKARAANDAVVAAVIAMAKQHGIDAAHIKTDYVSIEPGYAVGAVNAYLYYVRKSVSISSTDVGS